MLAMAVVIVSASPVFAVDPNGLVAGWASSDVKDGRVWSCRGAGEEL